MFSAIIMPDDAYKELRENFAMPLPIPKPSSIEGRHNLHYTSLEEDVKPPFTDKQQPSLIINRRRINNVINREVSIGERESRSTESDTQNTITQGKHSSGVVSSKYCMKPRCLYSFTSSNRMKPSLLDATTEPTFNAINL